MSPAPARERKSGRNHRNGNEDGFGARFCRCCCPSSCCPSSPAAFSAVSSDPAVALFPSPTAAVTPSPHSDFGGGSDGASGGGGRAGRLKPLCFGRVLFHASSACRPTSSQWRRPDAVSEKSAGKLLGGARRATCRGRSRRLLRVYAWGGGGVWMVLVVVGGGERGVFSVGLYVSLPLATGPSSDRSPVVLAHSTGTSQRCGERPYMLS